MAFLRGMTGLARTPRRPNLEQPVMVLPGLGASSASTALLRRYLKSNGYHAVDWGMGVNTGPRGSLDATVDVLERRLEQLCIRHAGKPAVLVGWSLGGIFARELAKRRKDLVRSVITLGTPLNGDPDATNAKMAYDLMQSVRVMLGGSTAQEEDATVIERIKTAPDVPCASIYSRSDGVVGWRSCMLPSTPSTASFELKRVSHMGLVSDPAALKALKRALDFLLAPAPGSPSAANEDASSLRTRATP